MGGSLLVVDELFLLPLLREKATAEERGGGERRSGGGGLETPTKSRGTEESPTPPRGSEWVGKTLERKEKEEAEEAIGGGQKGRRSHLRRWSGVEFANHYREFLHRIFWDRGRFRMVRSGFYSNRMRARPGIWSVLGWAVQTAMHGKFDVILVN